MCGYNCEMFEEHKIKVDVNSASNQRNGKHGQYWSHS